MSDFPRIYLDHNATTPPFPEVIEVVAETSRDAYGNPGSRHAEGRRARRILESSRESMATRLGCLPQEIVFTSGGTEATNLALRGLAFGKPRTIFKSPGDHPASRETIRDLQTRGWSVREMPIDTDGLFQADRFPDLPWADARIVDALLAHNETGVIQDLSSLSQLCLEHKIPLCVDAVQAVGKIPVHFHQLHAATLSLGAHKFHGPRGIGALLVREGLKLGPVLTGGHQEQGRRPGTEPVSLIAGMARALELCCDQWETRTARMAMLRDRLQRGLETECSPAAVNGAREGRLPNTLSIAFPGIDGEALLIALDLEGIACSQGSACASGSSEPAPILVAMGRSTEIYSASIRFSVGTENSPEEIDAAVARIAGVVRRLRSKAPR
jgi:cysteine desulfurase